MAQPLPGPQQTQMGAQGGMSYAAHGGPQHQRHGGYQPQRNQLQPQQQVQRQNVQRQNVQPQNVQPGNVQATNSGAPTQAVHSAHNVHGAHGVLPQQLTFGYPAGLQYPMHQQFVNQPNSAQLQMVNTQHHMPQIHVC